MRAVGPNELRAIQDARAKARLARWLPSPPTGDQQAPTRELIAEQHRLARRLREMLDHLGARLAIPKPTDGWILLRWRRTDTARTATRAAIRPHTPAALDPPKQNVSTAPERATRLEALVQQEMEGDDPTVQSHALLAARHAGVRQFVVRQDALVAAHRKPR